jgi:hypothetical protein
VGEALTLLQFPVPVCRLFIALRPSPYARCNHKPLTNILQWYLNLQPRGLYNSFVGEFLDAEEQLLSNGCKRPEDFSLKPPGSVALLPDWTHLIKLRGDDTFFKFPFLLNA